MLVDIEKAQRWSPCSSPAEGHRSARGGPRELGSCSCRGPPEEEELPKGRMVCRYADLRLANQALACLPKTGRSRTPMASVRRAVYEQQQRILSTPVPQAATPPEDSSNSDIEASFEKQAEEKDAEKEAPALPTPRTKLRVSQLRSKFKHAVQMSTKGGLDDGSCALARSCRSAPKKEGRETAAVAAWLGVAKAKVSQPKGKASVQIAPEEGNRGKQSCEGLTVFDAFNLAEKYTLPAGAVTQAWKVFKCYDTQDVGALSSLDFQLLLRTVLRERCPRAADIPRGLFEEASKMGDGITFTRFLDWMTENAFSEYWLLKPEERIIRKIARKFNVRLTEIEDVKRQFDKFDRDFSGCLDFSEFANLLASLLKVGDGSKFAESRLMAFWRQIDEDHSGVIEFKEFIPWYLTYFHGHTLAMSSPIQEYYRNIRPVPSAFYEEIERRLH